jgi:RES domain-containing protein
VIVWRLARRAYTRLDGEGARRYGGRWNRRGQPVVYCAEHLSLAVLEIIVHLELDTHDFPADYMKIAIEIPDSIRFERIASIPRQDDAMVETGSRWFSATRSACLRVPSVVIPEEHNLLLNPAHPEFSRIKPGIPAPFGFDSRLLRRWV